MIIKNLKEYHDLVSEGIARYLNNEKSKLEELDKQQNAKLKKQKKLLKLQAGLSTTLKKTNNLQRVQRKVRK